MEQIPSQANEEQPSAKFESTGRNLGVPIQMYVNVWLCDDLGTIANTRLIGSGRQDPKGPDILFLQRMLPFKLFAVIPESKRLLPPPALHSVALARGPCGHALRGLRCLCFHPVCNPSGVCNALGVQKGKVIAMCFAVGPDVLLVSWRTFSYTINRRQRNTICYSVINKICRMLRDSVLPVTQLLQHCFFFFFSSSKKTDLIDFREWISSREFFVKVWENPA